MTIKEPEAVVKDEYYLQPSDEVNFSRFIQDGEEYVSYLKNSSFRIWYNIWNTNYAPHWHEALEIIIPVKNTYNVIISGKTYILHPGDIFFIPPKQIHEIQAPDTGARISYLFNLETVKGLKTLSYIQTLLLSPMLFSKKTRPQIYDESYTLFLKICNTYFEFGELRELMIYSLLFRFFILLGTDNFSRIQEEINTTGLKKKKYYEKFEYLLSYIDRHSREPMTLETAAEQACFSKFHFERLFKSYSGMTFYEYLTHIRINKAVTLLSSSDLPITDIAFESGFENLTSFYRSFKKVKNCTPKQFKNRES